MQTATRSMATQARHRMFAAMMTGQGAFGSYQTLWPLYIAALGASPREVGLVLGLVSAIRLVAVVPSGMLTDRVPAGRIIVGGQLLMVAGLVAYAVSRTWWQLLPAGLVFACGAASFPAILATVAAIAGHGPQRVRTFTLINTVAPSIGLLVAPGLGGLIAARVGLRAVFVFAAALTLVTAALFARVPVPAPPPVDAEAERVTYRSTLRQTPILRWCLLEMAAIFCVTLGATFVPNYLHDVHGVSDGVIGAFGALSAVGSIALGLIVHRVPRFRRPVPGIALALLSVVGAMVLVVGGGRLAAFAAAYVLLGGFFATWTLFEAALSGVASATFRGRAYALAEILSGAGYALGPVVAGLLYARDPRESMLVGAALILALVVVLAGLARRGSIPEATHVEPAA